MNFTRIFRFIKPMHRIYVDVPYSYDYVYKHGEQDGPEVLTRDFGIKFEFICNASRGMFNHDRLGLVGNKGDAHIVYLDDPKDEMFFLIKSGFTKLNKDVVENYIKQHRKEMVI